MKKWKVISGVIVVAAITVGVLLNNKSRMQARSKVDQVKFLPVTLTTVETRNLEQELSLTGTITAANDVSVLSETQGRITRVYVNVGDRVSTNEVLVQLDDELKHANFVAAEVNYQKAKRDFERYEAVFRDGSVSDAQLEAARLAHKAAEAQYIVARRQYNDTKVKSPIAGIVTSRPFDVGTMIQNNSIVANVVDISHLKVKVNVAERDVFKLHAGDRVVVSTDVYPGVDFEGRISTISSKADDGHTYAVEIVLSNSAEHPLKAGMFGRVEFVAAKPAPALSIPRQALVGSMKHAQVFVVENGIAHLRNLVIGGEYGDNLEVRAGLKPGENVVLDGQNNLKDSVAVTIVK